MARPTRPQLVEGLDNEIADLSSALIPDDIRDEVAAQLTGLRDLLKSLDGHDQALTPDALQELSRAYLVGRRDAKGPLGGTVRRELWARLGSAGFDF